MFYGASFTYNNVPSELYDLRILNFDSSPGDSSAGSETSIVEKWIYRKDRPYYYGRTYQNSLEFDFTVGSFSPIPGNIRDRIEAWLVGQMTYQPLRIIQDDIMDSVFNVIFTKAPTKYIGNVNYALTLHAKCDRPWAIFYPPVLRKTYSSSPAIEVFKYNNLSDDSNYNKPIITFTMNSSGGDLSITNSTDSLRVFNFTGLDPYEFVTVDNDRQIITSSTGKLRMSTFNKNFFRLIRGVNDLSIFGNISNFTMTSIWAKKIGS